MLVQQLIIEIMTWAWTVFYCKQRTLCTNGWHYMYVFIQDVMQLQQCTVTTTTIHLSRFFSQLDKTKQQHTWFCVRFPVFPWISPACLDPYCKKPYFSDHVEEFLDLLHQHKVVIEWNENRWTQAAVYKTCANSRLWSFNCYWDYLRRPIIFPSTVLYFHR